jgi:hypothetical protein
MRLIDTYALQSASKIDKPFIYETFFPTPINSYITFQAQSQANIDAKNYAYWQDVIDIVSPVLQKENISIVQIGQPHESPYQRVVDLRGQTTVNQLAYLMRNSKLHVGPDSFGVHLASSYDVPLVALYSSTMPEIAGPQFGTASKQVCFKAYERIKNKKPSYALQEDPKSINAIKPEEIAKAVFQLLGINFQIPFETIYTGPRYSNAIIRELIPNNPTVVGNPDAPIEIRSDLFHDDNLVGHHLTYLKKAVVVTDKRISIKLLQHFKQNCPLIIYRITEKDEPAFVHDLVRAGFNVVLLSELSQSEIDNKKINYYEFGGINVVGAVNQELLDTFRPDLDKLYYRSCKLVVSNGLVHGSHAHAAAGKPMSSNVEYMRVIDSPSFWKDLEFCTIVKKLDAATTL